MNRTIKKGMALLVAVVMCICLLPMAAFAIEVVDAPWPAPLTSLA